MASAALTTRWNGDYRFLIGNLLLKDFRVRYRNMSLGFGWSVASPLIMMGVLTFIFTKVMPNNSQPHFPAFVLCGLVPFNFFSIAWVTGTISLIDNAGLVKRTTFPREIIPVSSVLANCLHFVIQIGLLIAIVLASGYAPNVYWLWLPYVVAFEIVFVAGLALAFSALDVYIRDTRYVVESANTVLFWLIPIFYDPNIIPQQYREIYRWNPLAAVVMAFRNILLENKEPAASLLAQLALGSIVTFVAGLLFFRLLKRRFFDYL
jgi:ABC-type polysaccharide/polyol phosphate export permease